MTTTHEAAVAAFAAAMTAALTPAFVTRDPDKAVDIEPDGTVVVVDGEPGDPEVIIGGPSYAWTRHAELHVMAVGDNRTAIVDGILAKIDPKLALDRTLGGTVDYASCTLAPAVEEVPVEGSETVRVALVKVQLEYTTATSAVG
ncbi:MAG: hypothetical protein ISS15_05355 [Alphaproteobacteria bacterium]|nr:hypothetical protein [Alphaproteobacteria bacterium]MBL6939453.1 hypothetical protein [Alphaproteobacteria bacterium]MBL7097066.1 hypothetical protein [Alphaproteobacteria bacterium]